jgi:hypothetical protein
VIAKILAWYDRSKVSKSVDTITNGIEFILNDEETPYQWRTYERLREVPSYLVQLKCIAEDDITEVELTSWINSILEKINARRRKLQSRSARELLNVFHKNWVEQRLDLHVTIALAKKRRGIALMMEKLFDAINRNDAQAIKTFIASKAESFDLLADIPESKNARRIDLKMVAWPQVIKDSAKLKMPLVLMMQMEGKQVQVFWQPIVAEENGIWKILPEKK